jgi:hypothetical protein
MKALNSSYSTKSSKAIKARIIFLFLIFMLNLNFHKQGKKNLF